MIARDFLDVNALLRFMTIGTTLTGASFILVACGGGGGSGADSSVAPSLAACGALNGKSLGGAVISAAPAPVGTYCNVTGLIGTQLQIEMRLPYQWSKRYVHIGGGNEDGVLPSLDSNTSGAATALAQGDVVAASNGGHVGNPAAPGGANFDASWALNNTPLIVDYEYAAIGPTDTAAKAVMQSFYGAQPQYAYFSGCSQGGREALNAAIHYTGNYDGVIAGAPVVGSAGLQVARAAIHNQLFGVPGNNLSTAKISLVASATLQACDALDGALDGIISNPDACHFDPSTLRCPGGDALSCLTDAQIQSVRTIRGDTTLSDGTIVYPHYGLGAEDVPSINWQNYLTDGSPSYPAPISYILLTGALEYFYFNDPNYAFASFNADRDYPTILRIATANSAQVLAADVVPFANAGKKMIIWQGESDYSLSTNATIAWYGELSTAMGGNAAVNTFSRFYILPGVQHCGGGTGADTFDQITAITNWVENGQAPQLLIASKLAANGATTLTRPMCVYPQYPRYSGGDINSAQSFTCSSN